MDLPPWMYVFILLKDETPSTYLGRVEGWMEGMGYSKGFRFLKN